MKLVHLSHYLHKHFIYKFLNTFIFIYHDFYESAISKQYVTTIHYNVTKNGFQTESFIFSWALELLTKRCNLVLNNHGGCTS